MEKKGLSNETIAVSLEDFQEDVMQEAVARTILKKYGKKDLSDYKVDSYRVEKIKKSYPKGSSFYCC